MAEGKQRLCCTGVGQHKIKGRRKHAYQTRPTRSSDWLRIWRYEVVRMPTHSTSMDTSSNADVDAWVEQMLRVDHLTIGESDVPSEEE